MKTGMKLLVALLIILVILVILSVTGYLQLIIDAVMGIFQGLLDLIPHGAG